MSTLTTPQPIIRAHDGGEQRWFYGGGVHTWKATAEETGGAFLLFEDRMEQGKMTPLHLHPESDETMYVLDGEILFHMDGVEHRVGPGGLAVAPRKVPHAFMVVSPVVRCSVYTPQVAARRSIGMPASQSHPPLAVPAPSTLPGSSLRHPRMAVSKSSARRPSPGPPPAERQAGDLLERCGDSAQWAHLAITDCEGLSHRARVW